MNSFSIFDFSMKAQGKTCDVYIDGIIVDESTRQLYAAWFDDTTSVSYKSLRTNLGNAVNDGVKTINLYVNSQGGNVIEAMAFHDYMVELENKGITINRIGRGIIASAATYFLCGKNSTITKNSWFMIHNCSGYAWGNVNEVEQMAKTLRKFNNQIVEFYVNKTGLPEKEISDMMDEETWMTGDEAKEKKFVSNCVDEVSFTNTIDTNKWMFQNTSVVSAYNSFTKKIPDMNKDSITNIINGVKDAFMNALKEAGIVKDENTTMCESLTNALDKALEPMNTGITDLVTEEITAQLGKIDIANMVTEAIAKVPPVDNSTEITELKKQITDLENKITEGAGSAKPDEVPAGPVTAENHKGISFQ